MAREELVKVPAVILGSRLRARRKSMRMSQHQLGGGDFSPSYVSAVERGKIRPSLKALYILSDRLGQPVTYFLQDEGRTNSADVLEEGLNAATVDIYHGKPADAIARLEQVTLNGEPPEAHAKLHMWLGEAYVANRQPAEAIRHLQEALRLAEAAGNSSLAAHARLYLGAAYYRQQKPQLALDVHRLCLKAIEDGTVKDLGFTLHVYNSLGEDLLALGLEKDALAYYESAMQAARRATDLRSLAGAHWAASASYREVNSAAQAKKYSEKSLAVYEALGMVSLSAAVRTTFASVLSATGQRAEALRLFNEAQDVAERIGEPAISALASIKLGDIHTQDGDYVQAEKLITAGVDMARAQNNALLEGQGLLSLANLWTAQNDRQQAEPHFQSAIARLEQAGAGDALSQAYFAYGQALAAWGDSARGSEYLTKAYLQTRKV